MAEFKGLVDRIVREEDGQGMIEYALIAALISIVAIVALRAVGTGALGGFTDVATELGETVGP